MHILRVAWSCTRCERRYNKHISFGNLEQALHTDWHSNPLIQRCCGTADGCHSQEWDHYRHQCDYSSWCTECMWCNQGHHIGQQWSGQRRELFTDGCLSWRLSATICVLYHFKTFFSVPWLECDMFFVCTCSSWESGECQFHCHTICGRFNYQVFLPSQ